MNIVQDRQDTAGRGPRKCRCIERGEIMVHTLSLSDPLPFSDVPPSAMDYRHALRAHWLRAQGARDADIAKELSRFPAWVAQCWRTSAELMPRPREVANYIAEYEQKMLRVGVEPFRPPSLRRGFVQVASGVYGECAASFPWEQAVLRKRNYETGEVTITSIASSRQDCSFPTLMTGVPRVDEAVQRVCQEFDICDPGAYLLCNWYPDGNTNIASHQHDFWSAILCFGAPRVFMLDNQPLLLGDGDLLVFGTQKHSVPKMPEVQDGRISVCIFWYPERKRADGTFVFSVDPATASAALDDDALAKVIASAAVAQLPQSAFRIEGRGVGRHAAANDSASGDEFLDEERIVQIALQMSLLEQ